MKECTTSEAKKSIVERLNDTSADLVRLDLLMRSLFSHESHGKEIEALHQLLAPLSSKLDELLEVESGPGEPTSSTEDARLNASLDIFDEQMTSLSNALTLEYFESGKV